MRSRYGGRDLGLTQAVLVDCGVRPDRLREEPLVSLWVDAAVPPMAERRVGRLLDDRGSGRLGALVVPVDVVDEHVNARGRADRCRIAKAARGLAEIDAAAGCRLQLGMKAP